MRTDDTPTAVADDVEPEQAAIPRDNVVPIRPIANDPPSDDAPRDQAPAGAPLPNQQEPDAQGGIERTHRFVCLKCAVVNNPKEPSDVCGSCGTKRPAPEAVGPALADAMRGALGDPQEIENLERQANGLKPIERRLPLRGVGKAFDFVAAFEDLHEISLEVAANEREHDELKKKTASAKTRLDDSRERMKNMFDHYYENMAEGANAPGLPFEGDAPASGCPVERELQAPCPACQSQRAKGVEADPGDPLHPLHPQHADIARSLLVKDMDDLVARLQKKSFHITTHELQLLPVGEVQILQRYAAQRGKVPPALLGRAHIAAEAGTERQECKRCSGVLLEQKNIDEGAAWYPALAAVGLDCPGPAVESETPADPPATPAMTEDEIAADEAAAQAERDENTAAIAAMPNTDPDHHYPNTGKKRKGRK